MRRILVFVVTLLVFSVLTGCAALQPVVATGSLPDPGSGYIAGLFTKDKGPKGYAFVIKSNNDAKEYVMQLGEDVYFSSSTEPKTIAIKVPPGTYSISQWISYSTVTKEVTSRNSITNPVLTKPFSVGVGSVVHLGKYDSSSSSGGSYYDGWAHHIITNMRIRPLRPTTREVQGAFAMAYPGFESLVFSCLLCVDAGNVWLER